MGREIIMAPDKMPLSDAQILKLLPIGWVGSAANILQLARAVEAAHGIVTLVVVESKAEK
jgi:hypothetical protein